MAIAWVIYTSGQLFRVDTRNASCTATSFAPNQQGEEVFGMGFASDAVGSNTETLFVAGGSWINYQLRMGPVRLSSLAFPGMTVGSIGPFSDWAEMTGTGDARLWAYFADASPPRIAQIDKTTGAESNVFPLPSLQQASGAGWAFAFWGGDFWIFLEPSGSNTSVYRFRPSDSSLMAVLPNTGRHIVGAGVSTCAPIVVP